MNYFSLKSEYHEKFSDVSVLTTRNNQKTPNNGTLVCKDKKEMDEYAKVMFTGKHLSGCKIQPVILVYVRKMIEGTDISCREGHPDFA